MSSRPEVDVEALKQSRNLVQYLAELSDVSNRDPVRDILSDDSRSPDTILWVDEIPADVLTGSEEDELVRIAPVPLAPPPHLPPEITDWVDQSVVRTADGSEPELRLPPDIDPMQAGADELLDAKRPAFEDWLETWRLWAADEPARRHRRSIYDALEHAAKVMEQRDDEFEFVLGAGLLVWRTPDRVIRRHLLIERAHPAIDRTGVIRIHRVPGTRRMEDREVLGELNSYRPDRGRALKEDITRSDILITANDEQAVLRDWLSLALDVLADLGQSRTAPAATPVFSTSPAFLLRRRTKVMIAEAYRRIAEGFGDDEIDVPVGFAQLVVETDHEQREHWLATRGATRSDVLGADPLFPLPSNEEQSQVMELLRTETGIVVQGPPGTGKTHTIANLVAALLARGQRVLVTSQKDQALRVLRDKIPTELRNLCVLLAGGSRDAATELRSGIEALSSAIASTDERSLRNRAQALRNERLRLQQRSAILNKQVRDLREVERKVWSAVAPEVDDRLYHGTLAEIAAQVRAADSEHGWMPLMSASAPAKPPLSAAEFGELLTLTRSRTPARAWLFDRTVPSPGELPTVGDLVGLFAAESQARTEVASADLAGLEDLSRLDLAALDTLADSWQRAEQILSATGVIGSRSTPAWARRALASLVDGQDVAMWLGLNNKAGGAEWLLSELDRLDHSVVEFEPVTAKSIAQAQQWVTVGEPLLDHLRKGGRIKRFLPSKAQRDAQALLDSVQVNGVPIETSAQLEAALARIKAEVATVHLAEHWADVGLTTEQSRLRPRLWGLANHARLLNQIVALGDELSRLRAGVVATVNFALNTLDDIVRVGRSIPAIRTLLRAEAAQRRVEELRQSLTELVAEDCCPSELSALASAVGDRDSDRCAKVLDQISQLRVDKAAEIRQRQLASALGEAIPELTARIEADPGEHLWANRDLAAAWAWSRASAFVTTQRTAEAERKLVAEFDQVEDVLRSTTEKLVAIEAMSACRGRLTDEQTRALNTYRELMGKIGAGYGKKTAEYRRAARAAMSRAQDAVPAWVVPLPNLLENIAAQRDRFDVVIVDEASQVGIEHLYLLWMAPRVIVVGDDKQCTPSDSALGKLDDAFNRNLDHLGNLPLEVRHNLTPKSNLYGALTARQGKNGLIRLREHFRCVPEIIRWSSDQFYRYGPDSTGLSPLRERRVDDLEPLKVTEVEGGFIEGGNGPRKRNPIEAKEIVETLLACLADPAYDSKTFGIVVLQNAPGHLRHLEHLINESVPPEDRQARQIRVGTAPDFQGDERDVIFLSTVAVGEQRLVRAESYQQSYNVAASRARDQLWLITSLERADLQADDLRTSLMGYMTDPPSVFGQSPDLEMVSDSKSTPPFDSLFEQRVFRIIKKRGYHVVPQYPVGSRRLDLVVVGDGGRIAVECDGHYWHAGYDEQVSDARRDRELARMGWRTVRIRESEFALDPNRELEPVWTTLAARNINPRDAVTESGGGWEPVPLVADDLED